MVYCTCPDGETAATLAEQAINTRLAACVNVVPSVTSSYRWEGRVARDEEALLMAKSVPAAFDALAAAWQQAHPYELPEIIAVPISYASEPYLTWIESCVDC